MNGSLFGSHNPSAPTMNGTTIASHPCWAASSARSSSYFARFSAAAASNAARRLSKGTVTSTMKMFEPFFRT